MGKGRRITDDQTNTFWSLRSQGWSIARAAQASDFSMEKGKSLERERREILGIGSRPTGDMSQEARNNLYRQDPAPEHALPPSKWCDAAQEALADKTGQRFTKRYLGIELSRWQQYMWQQIDDAWNSPDREYRCVNAPPGLGKSTVLVGYAAKITVVKRDVRGLFMSRSYSLAERNTLRLRRALERTMPFVQGEATLAKDFGRFRARTGELWRRNEFIVEQMDGSPIEEKEPTWAAFGFDAEWLGNRLDILFGDDLDSTRSIRNLDTVENNRDIFDNELEPRVEAGGLLCIAQQRLGSFDFSNHALAKRILPDDDGVDEDPEGTPQYGHIIFKAHYEELCKGIETHRHPAPSWPDGCLLDAKLLSYRDLRKSMRDPRTFQIVFQQNDMADESALVQQIWVEGGRAATGEYFQGCWDDDRDVWQLPGSNGMGFHALGTDTIGVISVDPSPTKFWSVQAWVFHQPSSQHFLIDMRRERMDAPDFLDWSPTLGCFTGLLEDWYHQFLQLGVALSWVIVEINAAQRFMLQYDFFHRWMRQTGVQIIAHSTNRNKSDPDFGVQMLAPLWQAGRIRLPGKQGHKSPLNPAHRLVEEITRYPNSTTDDCVMAHWFAENNAAKLYVPTVVDDRGHDWRPSWLSKAPAT